MNGRKQIATAMHLWAWIKNAKTGQKVAILTADVEIFITIEKRKPFSNGTQIKTMSLDELRDKGNMLVVDEAHYEKPKS